MVTFQKQISTKKKNWFRVPYYSAFTDPHAEQLVANIRMFEYIQIFVDKYIQSVKYLFDFRTTYIFIHSFFDFFKFRGRKYIRIFICQITLATHSYMFFLLCSVCIFLCSWPFHKQLLTNPELETNGQGIPTSRTKETKEKMEKSRGRTC